MNDLDDTILVDIEVQLDLLHDALREAATDHTIYPTKDTPVTLARALRAEAAVFRYGCLIGHLKSRCEALQHPDDFAAFERFQCRFRALIDSFPMPPVGDTHDHTVH